MERYQSLVCAITYSATGNFATSQELAQETFVKAWKSLGGLRNLKKFRAWLCTIARNLVRDEIKSRSADIVGGGLEGARALEADGVEPSETAVRKEHEALVWQALRKIPTTYREPMVLFYREEQSIGCVAAELELSESAVKQRLSRGRKLLKAEVAGLVEDVLGRTGPKKAFAVAVIAALPAVAPQAASAAVAGIAVKGSIAAKAAGFLAFAGAVLGPLLGFLGSVIGIRASVLNTNSLREREFMKKRAYLSIVMGAAFMAIFLLYMSPWMRGQRWVLFVLLALYLALVFYLAYTTNRKRRAIQIEEGTYIEPKAAVRTKGQIYGAFAGGIFGSLLWVHLVAVSAKDYLTVWLLLLAAFAIFIAATRICIRNKRYFDHVGAVVFAAVGLVTLLAVNLRWDNWMSVLGDKPKYRDISLWQVNLVIIAATVLLVAIPAIFVALVAESETSERQALRGKRIRK